MRTILFLLLLIPNIVLSQCAGVQSATLSPLPTNGTYQPGTVVTMCYTMNGWNGDDFSGNWIEGFDINLGSGWVLYTPVSAPGNCSANGEWIWMETVTSDATALVAGPGYFYEGPSGPIDGNSGNDWGDNYISNNCQWTFCIQLQVSDECDPLSLLIEVTPYADGTMGSWGINGNNDVCNPQVLTVFNGTIAGGNVNTSLIGVDMDTVCVGLSQTYSVVNTPNSTYDWTLSNGGVLTEDGTNIAFVDWGGVPGDYVVSVQETTVDGCVGDIIDTTINVSDTLITFSQPRTGICLGDSVHLSAIPSGGFWSGENLNNDIFTGYNSGTYYPTYFVNIHGCPVVDSVEVFVREPFTAPIIYTELLDVDLCLHSNEQFLYVPDDFGVEYTWHVDGVLQNDTDFELYQMWEDSTTDHVITVYGTDTIGCVSETSYLRIDVEACHRLFIPLSFTPNGDGYNDAFKIVGESLYEPHMQIFDRNGMVIYEIKSLTQTWNGNDGTGYYCQSGVYNWVMTYKDDKGFNHTEKGHVVLIR